MTSDANSLAKAALERVLAVTCGQIQLSRRAEQRLRFRIAVAGRVRALAYSVERKLAKFRVLAQPSAADRKSCCLRISAPDIDAARSWRGPRARLAAGAPFEISRRRIYCGRRGTVGIRQDREQEELSAPVWTIARFRMRLGEFSAKNVF